MPTRPPPGDPGISNLANPAIANLAGTAPFIANLADCIANAGWIFANPAGQAAMSDALPTHLDVNVGKDVANATGWQSRLAIMLPT